MKYFFSKRGPQTGRMLLVESGPREILEKLLPHLYQTCPAIDVVSCFAVPPSKFRGELGDVFQVADFQGKEGRARLYRYLRERNSTSLGIICADQPIMTKWKWAIAAQIPAKLFVINENGDYFWVDYTNWRIITHFAMVRLGLTGAEAVPTITRLVLFPFTLLFLLTYAAIIHTKRRLRLLLS